MSRAAAVVVMAKAPRPGLAKTRLHPLFGAQRAAMLQAVLITQAVSTARAVAPTYVAHMPADAREEFRTLVPAGVELLVQRGAHLGERMAGAVTDVAARGHSAVVVIGTDVPTLQPARLQDAFDALAGDGPAGVIGPAVDGGYYLIGSRGGLEAAFAIDPVLWGGEHVLSATLDAFAAAGTRVTQLSALRDLDTPEDAAVLLGDPWLPQVVASALRPDGVRA